MGELTIRRNRGFADNVRMPVTGKTDKSSGAASAQRTAARGTGITVSPTIHQSMTKGAEAAARESRRTLQSGEAVLSEIKNTLDRLADLAKESADGEPDRAALQKELVRLQGEIDRMVNSALSGGSQLFAAGGTGSSGLDALPKWLLNGITQDPVPTAEQVLRALGMDQSVDGAKLLAALSGASLESSPTAGYLSALYLGAVISGGGEGRPMDLSQALEGLEKFMQAIDDGMSPDEALEALTNGEFTSFEEFQEQFSAGTLPGFQDFLTTLLLTGGNASLLDELSFSLPSLLDMMDGMNFDLMMDLLEALQNINLGELEFGETTQVPLDNAQEAAMPQAESTPVSVMRFGDVQVMGRDLSGVSVNDATGEVLIGGSADVVVQGTGPAAQAIQITGSGTVTLQNVNVSTLTVGAEETNIAAMGKNTVGLVQMNQGTALTVSGNGTLHLASLRGDQSNVLHLAGGAVVLRERDGASLGALGIPVILEGAASLAAQASQVRTPEGRAMEPFDILWKALLPGFDSITSMALDGRQTRMLLSGGEHADPARLWMEKGDLSAHGYPGHRLVIRGRDQAGQARTRYAYLYWNQRGKAVEAVDMYPNPFTVTGGEPGQDWIYEEASRTLRILSGQVSAVAGGTGTDAEEAPFSGRIVLADSIGALALALDGVVCRVSEGRAFDLGRENDVTLILQTGTSNCFESGAACAGIFMGDGTSLRIDCAGGSPAGTLTASGGVGIGQDGGRKQTGHIHIHGGAITGTEKKDGAESVTIVGGIAPGRGAADPGGARVMSRMGISLKIGDDTVILPQFRLSANSLRLDGLDVSSKEFARAAALTLEADKRWVHRLHRVYENITTRMEHSAVYAAGQRTGTPAGTASPARAEEPVRDAAAATSLLEGMSRAIPLSSAQAMRTHGSRDASEVQKLLRR